MNQSKKLKRYNDDFYLNTNDTNVTRYLELTGNLSDAIDRDSDFTLCVTLTIDNIAARQNTFFISKSTTGIGGGRGIRLAFEESLSAISITIQGLLMVVILIITLLLILL